MSGHLILVLLSILNESSLFSDSYSLEISWITFIPCCHIENVTTIHFTCSPWAMRHRNNALNFLLVKKSDIVHYHSSLVLDQSIQREKMTLVTLKSNIVSIAHNRRLSSSVDMERERKKEGRKFSHHLRSSMTISSLLNKKKHLQRMW